MPRPRPRDQVSTHPGQSVTGDQRRYAIRPWLPYCARLSKAFTVPFQTTANRPFQDARPFGLELIGQVAVAFVERYLDLKGNDTNTTPECIVSFADARTIIGRER